MFAGILCTFLILGIFLRPIEPVKVHMMKKTLHYDENETQEEQFMSSIESTSLRSSKRSQNKDSLLNSVAKHPTLSSIAETTRYINMKKECILPKVLAQILRSNLDSHELGVN